MAPEREQAVKAMQNMGWAAKKIKRGKTQFWEFRRLDTGGTEDLIRRRQEHLSLSMVADIAMAFGDANDLALEIKQAKKRWVRQLFCLNREAV